MSSPDLPLHEAVSAFKRTVVLEALAANGGTRSRTAAALKIERTSLLRLIRELGIARLLSDGQRGRPRSPASSFDEKPSGRDEIEGTESSLDKKRVADVTLTRFGART